MKQTAFVLLTDDEGLFEGGPGDIVPRWSAGGVDGPLVGPQQRRLCLGLARGPFTWRQRRGQRTAGDPVGETVHGIFSAPAAFTGRGIDKQTARQNMTSGCTVH